MNIISGILSSLIATVLWWIFGLLFLKTRKKIDVQLALLRKDNHAYQKFLELKDYNLALNQSQRMLNEIGKIYFTLNMFTYRKRKQKFFETVLNNLFIRTSKLQGYYLGYEKVEEEKIRYCEKALEDLYTVSFTENKERNQYCNNLSAIEVSIEILSEINSSYKSLTKTLKKFFYFNLKHKSNYEKKFFYKSMISVESFKDSYGKQISRKFQLSKNVFEKNEYNNLIDKVFVYKKQKTKKTH